MTKAPQNTLTQRGNGEGVVKSKTHVWTNVKFDLDGKQVSALNMEWSVTRSAYGIVQTPIVVVRNGPGPTLLLMAGNHGDEFEGQIVLTKLIQTLVPEEIRGRLIILPAANLAAAIEGTRVSPLDAGNLNRSFPGDPTGTPTQRIAHYISDVLMPMSDAFFDLHSGGTSLVYLPYVHVDLPGRAEANAQAKSALEFINPPLAVAQPFEADDRIGAAQEIALKCGVLSFSGEFAGAASVSEEAIRVAQRSVFRLMAHLGIVELDPQWSTLNTTRWLFIDRGMYLFAPADGLFQPSKRLGDDVKAGALFGQVIFPEEPSRAPVDVCFPRDGLLGCIRPLGRIRRGDCLGHLFGYAR
jgi:predicted deacylase